MERKFEAKIILSNDEPTLAEGIKTAKKTIQAIGLNAIEIKPIISHRTLAQNNALHLLFTQLADELNSKGLDMRTLIRQEVEISWNAYTVKEYLWKPLQKILTGKNSTTKLNKTEEINLIYNNLNRILIDRTAGEINLPPFPSFETLTEYD